MCAALIDDPNTTHIHMRMLMPSRIRMYIGKGIQLLLCNFLNTLHVLVLLFDSFLDFQLKP